MKKLLSFAIGILLLCGALFGCNKLLNQKANDGGNKTLTIYNWGDYIDPQLITKF